MANLRMKPDRSQFDCLTLQRPSSLCVIDSVLPLLLMNHINPLLSRDNSPPP